MWEVPHRRTLSNVGNKRDKNGGADVVHIHEKEIKRMEV